MNAVLLLATIAALIGRRVSRLSGATAAWLIASCAPGLLADGTKAGDAVFDRPRLIAIEVQIEPEQAAILNRGMNGSERARARATVIEGERRYTNVSVQLKGYTTMRPIGDRPSLTLKFNRHERHQRFHGLEKISLNNALQDPTRLHEVLARELFAAAGIPVPRATHATLTLNGRHLGVYVLVEGYDNTFLSRHFSNDDGPLYEGGTMRDIHRSPRLSSGYEGGDRDPVQRLITAARVTNPEARFGVFSQVLDLDRFLDMVAMETLLCHSDSYSMNRNNYRFYLDPESEKFVFMPHGMDRILGTHRSRLDLSIVPPQLGMVSRAILTTEPGRRRYLQRLETLLNHLRQNDRWCERIRQFDVPILEAKNAIPLGSRNRNLPTPAHDNDADELCRRLSERVDRVAAQLRAMGSYLAIPRFARFDESGVCPVAEWVPGGETHSESVSLRVEKAGDRTLLRLKTRGNPLRATLHSRLILPTGDYQVTGMIHALTPTNPAPAISMSYERGSASRFQLQRRSLDDEDNRGRIQVVDSFAPEELEFLCEVRADSAEVVLDVTGLKVLVASQPESPRQSSARLPVLRRSP